MTGDMPGGRCASRATSAPAVTRAPCDVARPLPLARRPAGVHSCVTASLQVPSVIAAATLPARDDRRLLTWRRLRVTLVAAVILGLLQNLTSSVTPAYVWIARAMTVGLLAMLAFGRFEQGPARLKPWLARWVGQLVCEVVAIPFAAWFASTQAPIQAR